jgi:hypothetical protein
MQEMDNPIFLIIVLCACWPGVVPVAAAWFIGRRYDVRMPFVDRHHREEMEI